MSVNASKNSQPPLSAAERMIDRMKVYSSFRPDQVPEYRKAFTRMLNEFGEKRLNLGMTAAIDAIPSFPPTPAEIRKYIPPPEEFKFCGQCQNGWIVINPTDKPSNWKARRCECVLR